LLGSENWFYDFIPGRKPFEELEAALLLAVNPPSSLL
jgi:hypothetical protein